MAYVAFPQYDKAADAALSDAYSPPQKPFNGLLAIDMRQSHS